MMISAATRAWGNGGLWPEPMDLDETGDRTGRILVVDDDDEVRQILAEALEEVGHAVVRAASGEEALALLDQHPDLVITDIRMPGMSGLELVEQARARRRDLKVILISGYFDPDQQPRPWIGHERFLRKPFRLHELVSAVQAALA